MSTIIEGIKLYTVLEVAKILNVTHQTVRSYIKSGRLKGVRIGRPIMVTEKSIHDFLGVGSPLQAGIK